MEERAVTIFRGRGQAGNLCGRPLDSVARPFGGAQGEHGDVAPLGLSWRKIELGMEVRWIGANVYIKGKEIVGTAIPEKYCKELEKEALRLLESRVNPAREIRCLAGRASWAGGIVPCVASLLHP